MTSAQVPLSLLAKPYDRPHLDAPPVDHAQPLRSYGTPLQPSVHMTAYLSTHMSLSGFKPGSTLLDPGRGQPISLGSLRWSIMSLDGLVHLWKIAQVYLMCPH